MLGLQNEREWAAFCDKVLLTPALATDERFCANFKRSANREALRRIIVDSFARLDAEAVIQRLEHAQIASARVNDMHGVWDHPQLKARDSWREVASPAGPLPALLPPARNTAFSPRMDAVPALGEHSQGILDQLGYSGETIDDLRARGVI